MRSDDLRRRRDAARIQAGARVALVGRSVVAVVGAPCSGKSTHVAANAGPGDVVVDFDALAVAFGSPVGHDHAEPFRSLAHAARDAAIERFRRAPNAGRLWLVVTSARQLAQWGAEGCERVVMSTPLAECERRAVASGRDPDVIEVIRGWSG